MAGCLFTQQRWIVTLMCPQTRCHSTQFSRLTCDEIKTLSEKKVSTCEGTFSPPGEALSVCPPVTIDLNQKRIRDVTTLASNDWHLSVVDCLHLSPTPAFSQDVVQHAQKYKNRNLFSLMTVFQSRLYLPTTKMIIPLKLTARIQMQRKKAS